jgi:hypothetical protein
MAWKSDGRHGNLYELMVPSKVKMDHELFIDLVWKPLVEKDIPRLYRGEERKAILYMDSAGAHIHENFIHWLIDSKIKFIPTEERMSNSPDLSPMDYAVNSIFRGICNRQEAKI